LKCSSNDYKTPFERLQCTKPDVAHLRVFRCGAYVFLPEDVRSNNLSPRSELMTFIGLVEGIKGYIFMRSPNNIVFTAIQALFDETLFPKCPNMHCLGYVPVGLTPDDLQDEHNGPPDNENGDDGDKFSPIPIGPAGGQVLWQHMQPPLQPPMPLQPPVYPSLPPSSPSSSGHSSSGLSYMPGLNLLNPNPVQDKPWKDTYVPPPSRRMWHFSDDWTPYQCWAYSYNTPEDDHLRLTNPDAFWPNELIGDQNLNTQECALRREQMGIPPIPPQPQEELSGSQLRHSGHERRPAICPDNVYRSQNPI
jgi:hypothetical protein